MPDFDWLPSLVGISCGRSRRAANGLLVIAVSADHAPQFHAGLMLFEDRDDLVHVEPFPQKTAAKSRGSLYFQWKTA